MSEAMLRARAIAEYHELLSADAGLTAELFARLKAAMRARQLLYGAREIGVALRPHLLTREHERNEGDQPEQSDHRQRATGCGKRRGGGGACDLRLCYGRRRRDHFNELDLFSRRLDRHNRSLAELGQDGRIG